MCIFGFSFTPLPPRCYRSNILQASNYFMPAETLSDKGPGGGGWIHFNKHMQVPSGAVEEMVGLKHYEKIVVSLKKNGEYDGEIQCQSYVTIDYSMILYQ